MTSQEQLDQKIDRWLEAGAPTQMPDRVLLATFERTRRSRQHRRWPALLGRIQVNPTVAPVAAVAVVVVAISGLALYVNQPGVGGRAPTPTHAASPSMESGDRVAIWLMKRLGITPPRHIAKLPYSVIN